MRFEMLDLNKCIRELELRYHKPVNSVQLLAVSKQQSIAKIQTAIDAGYTAFGESYLQEALPKIEHFKKTPHSLTWHFIGPIQGNKTKKIAENFDWVQSVDSMKIAKRLNDQRPEHLPPLNICLQINISDEPTKSGIQVNDLFTLAEFCKTLPRITLRGLMAIPAPQSNFDDQRKVFHALRLLFDALNEKNFSLDTLSMGMSNDMEAAIAEGSTMVRIGTALFGTRIIP